MGYCKQRANRQGHARYTAHYWDLRGRASSAGTFSRKRDAERAWQPALTALHRTRTTNAPHTPAPGQLTVTDPPSRQPQN